MKTKLKAIYGAHPILWTIILLALVIGIGALVYFFPAFGLEAAEIPVVDFPQTAVLEEIPVGGTVTVAQNGGRTLTLDTENMILTLTDDATGLSWSSATQGIAPDNTEDKALLKVTFLGEDNAETSWNSYDNCVAFGSYKYFAIENGVRIELDANEGDSKVYLEYLPSKFPKATWEGFIIPGVHKLLEEGTITQAEHDRYISILESSYNIDQLTGDSYNQAFSGNSPAKSARNALITLTGLIGYTREMLIADCAVYDIVPEFHEPAQFDIVVEVTLDAEGDLIARVPSNQIVSGNPFYQMQRVAVLPNMGAVAASGDQDGFLLVPDGSGALMRFNTFTGTMTKYDRPYLDNDYYADYYFMSEYAEELRMPIFGILYGVDTPTHGMLAIIEHGVETANLHAELGSTTGTGKNATYGGDNRVYASVDTLEHARVKIYGAYSDNGATYTANSGHILTDFTVRYHPYAEPVTYFDLAMTYRDYLARTSGKEITAPQGPQTYVEVLGAVRLTEHMLGVPTDKITSMSTYNQVKEIIETLPENVVVQYDGAFNDGVISALNDGAELVDENGTVEELKALLDAAEAKNTRLYWQVNISRVYDNGRNYLPGSHALRDYSNEAAEIYLYTPDTAMFNGTWDPIRPYTRVSPRYLPTLANAVMADLKEQELQLPLAIDDLGHDVFVDYRYNDVIDPVEANLLTETALNTLSANSLVLNDPNSEVAPLADYVLNVSRKSSDYVSFYATIPFRHLALSGLTGVVGQDVNLNSRDLNYYLLQAAETGASVKYTVSASNPDVFKSSHFESYYAADWSKWQADILKAAKECAKLREIIGGQAITGHALLTPEVFETTYANGVRVITNYAALPYEAAEGTVDAQSYLIIGAVTPETPETIEEPTTEGGAQ